MSDRKQTLGMEPSEQRSLGIMRLAFEQAQEIQTLQTALDEMTERCRSAEIRARAMCAGFILGFQLHVPEMDICPTPLGGIHARDLAMVRTLKS